MLLAGNLGVVMDGKKSDEEILAEQQAAADVEGVELERDLTDEERAAFFQHVFKKGQE